MFVPVRYLSRCKSLSAFDVVLFALASCLLHKRTNNRATRKKLDGIQSVRSWASNCSFFLSIIKWSFLLHGISTLQMKIKCFDYKIRKAVLIKIFEHLFQNKFYRSLHVLRVFKKGTKFYHPRNKNHDYIRNTNLGHEKEIKTTRKENFSPRNK
jgi:hypothetical protein